MHQKTIYRGKLKEITKLKAFDDFLFFPVPKTAVIKYACNSTISGNNETSNVEPFFQPDVNIKVDQLRANNADLLVFGLKINLIHYN